MDTDDKTITLNPSPGFVIKTHLLKSRNKRDQGIKVFINACTDPQIPQPEEVYGEELFMRIQNGEDWIVPIVVSKQREDVDRAGKRALVWDCCMHPRVVLEATKDKGVKVILIETCIELVEDSSSVELSRGECRMACLLIFFFPGAPASSSGSNCFAFEVATK